MAVSIRKIDYQYVITKNGMERWFLYTIEDCSYGKKASWTLNFENALRFSTEQKAEIFKTKYLGNANVNIRKFATTEPWFS